MVVEGEFEACPSSLGSSALGTRGNHGKCLGGGGWRDTSSW